jgi:hypothetical protein
MNFSDMLDALYQYVFPPDPRVVQLEQELAAAQARAAADRLAFEGERRVFEKSLFIERMQAISSSSSKESGSGTDVHRRGAPSPETVPLDALLVGYAEGTIRALPAWKAAIAAPTYLPMQPERLDENRDLHPLVQPFVQAAVSATESFKLWSNVVAADDIDKAEIKPDFTVTHIREALPSLLAACLLVEVKHPKKMNHAIEQTCSYLRRQVYKAFREANDRGEEGFLSEIHAWGVATDGCSIRLLRLSSGAPKEGGSYAGANPCPLQMSPELGFLDWGWEQSRQGPPSGHPMSQGFAALVRLLSALGNTSLPWKQPLISLSTVVRDFHGEDLVEAPAAAAVCAALGIFAREAMSPPAILRLTRHLRLGCGGSSDAYECSAGGWAVGVREGEGGAGEGGEGGAEGGAQGGPRFVLKVPRSCTKEVLEGFERECTALRALKHAGARGLVPVLLGRGARALADSAYVPELEKGQPDWPVLLLHPVGRSLEAWMGEAMALEKRGGGGGGGGGGSVTTVVASMRCATTVALRVSVALRAAHDAGFIHCDLRPSNLAVASGSGEVFVLDWGLARQMGEPAKGVGVGAFSSERAFDVSTKRYPAIPALDALAVLYTWLSLSFNSTGSAPWGRECGSAAKMHADRREWIDHKRTTHKAVEAVAAAIDAIAEGEVTSPPTTLDAMGIVQGALGEAQRALGGMAAAGR